QENLLIGSVWSILYIPGSVMKTLYTLDESFDMYVDLGDDHANKAQGWKVSALLGYSDEYGPFYGAKKVFDVAQQTITKGHYGEDIEIDKSTMVDEPIATVAVLNSQVSLHINGIADLSGYKKIGFKFYSSVDGVQFSFHHSWNDWELSPVLTLHEGMNTVIIDASWICENALYPLSSSTDVTGHFAITDIYAF
ncbi:MAG: hypothetical protein MJ072_03350, partial [Clostridia bacterium]|nr:hypothetical protein [Clostridia bacterium]